MRLRVLYWVPNGDAKNPRLLPSAGLASRFTGVDGFIGHSIIPLSEGPGGGPGSLVGIGDRVPDYDPAGQKFEQSIDKQFWLAIEDADCPPGPQDLIRETVVTGCEIELADLHPWIVPMLRRWDRATSQHISRLPKAFSVVDGRMQLAVAPEYRGLDEIADLTFNAFLQNRKLSINELFRDAVNILAVNYRIGIEEAALLGLLDEASAMAALGASIDLEEIHAHAESAALDGLAIGVPNAEESLK